MFTVFLPADAGRKTTLITFGPKKWGHVMIPRKVRYVAVSDFARRELERIWGMSSKSHDLRVIPNTCGPAIPEARTPPAKPSVLTVGHVIGYKNPLTWIQIAERVCQEIPDVTFTWLGEGPDLGLCREIVAESVFGDRIRFVGHIEDVSTHYNEAHAYVHLSTVENSPFAVLEAMRRGVRCVLSESGGMRELAHNGDGAILVKPEEPEATAKTIVRLLTSEESVTSLGRISLDAYRNFHDSEAWTSHIQELHVSQH